MEKQTELEQQVRSLLIIFDKVTKAFDENLLQSKEISQLMREFFPSATAKIISLENRIKALEDVSNIKRN